MRLRLDSTRCRLSSVTQANLQIAMSSSWKCATVKLQKLVFKSCSARNHLQESTEVECMQTGLWKTDTGINFFYPGKTDDEKKVFVTDIACLAYGLCQYNELVRCAVSRAGNDHRFGAQEAPPAIISLYPGAGFEAHVDAVIAGGGLLGYKAEKKLQSTGCSASMPIQTNVEDRNRTAPFPFCGNRFEFRAVGSSQNCAFPVMICNTIMAAGMAHLAGQVEDGMYHRDAVAKVFVENKKVIFTGNGYSTMAG